MMVNTRTVNGSTSAITTMDDNLQLVAEIVARSLQEANAELLDRIEGISLQPVYEGFDELPKRKKPKQEGSVKEYYELFKSFVDRMGLGDSFAVRIFIEGLQPEIERNVRLFEPKTLHEAYLLANLQEATIAFKKKKESNSDIPMYFSSKINNSKVVEKENMELAVYDESGTEKVNGNETEGMGLIALDELCKEIVDDSGGMAKDSDCVMVLDDDFKETESRVSGMDDENTTVELEENCGLNDNKGEDNVLVASVNGWEYFEGRKVKNKSGYVVPACDVVVSNFLFKRDDDKTRGEIEEGYNRKQDDARKEKKYQVKGCDGASFLETKDSCKLEIISKNGNENATKNREGLGHLKFDIWEWPNRKKVDGMNYKFKHEKIKFDVWKWPKRKKKGQGAKSHECCVMCGAAVLGLICSGYMEEGRSLMGIYFQLNGAGDRYHHFDTRILFSLVLVYANHGKIMGLVHSNHGKSIKTFLLEILKMTTRAVIHHGVCLGLGLTRKSVHEMMKQGLVSGIALLVHGGMKTIALAYNGTGNNKAIEKLLYFAVSDVNNDESHALEPVTSDVDGLVRQGALITMVMVMIQTSEAIDFCVWAFKGKLKKIIRDREEDTSVKLGYMFFGFVLVEYQSLLLLEDK